MKVIEMKNICKSFGSLKANENVNFDLEQGEMHALLGENGACNVTRSVSKMTEIERRGGKRWDKPKKAEKSRDCGGGKF